MRSLSAGCYAADESRYIKRFLLYHEAPLSREPRLQRPMPRFSWRWPDAALMQYKTMRLRSARTGPDFPTAPLRNRNPGTIKYPPLLPRDCRRPRPRSPYSNSNKMRPKAALRAARLALCPIMLMGRRDRRQQAGRARCRQLHRHRRLALQCLWQFLTLR